MLKPSAVLLYCVLVVPARMASAAEAQSEATALLERFVAAHSSRLDEALALLADDALVYDESLEGQPVRLEGKEALRKHLEARLQALPMSNSQLGDLRVRTAQDSAWVGATWNHQLSYGETSDSWKQLVTFYLRRDAAGWKIAGWHASPAEAPEMPFEGDPDELSVPGSDAEAPGSSEPTRPTAQPTP
jgi:ketosteroid isomerase-like protein